MIFLLILTLFLVSCSHTNPNIQSVEDCSKLRNHFQKDECYIELASKIASENLDKALTICEQITDSMIKDLCYLYIFEQRFGLISNEQLEAICEKIENTELQDNCNRKASREHLRGFVK